MEDGRTAIIRPEPVAELRVAAQRVPRKLDGTDPLIAVLHTHLPRPSCRVHHRLVARRDARHDLSDLWLEAHVQHPVGLVHHHVGHLIEPDLIGERRRGS
eukprot:scaffold188235_cov28-Tisochrysis_lutea.AAC.2